MPRQYHLDSVFLRSGWVRDALVTVGDDGYISRIDSPSSGEVTANDAVRDSEPQRVAGFVVPGMPNSHSHAFQRAMAGNTEYRLSTRDSFWTWREAMYALANRVTPEDLQVIAAQLFVEMLKAGYTSVAEFHYLHRQTNGNLDPEQNGLWDAVTAAAEATGIGLTLLPALYQTSDFGGAPLKREQARFALETEWFVRAIENRVAAEKGVRSATRRTGAAFHSLRAVPLASLKEALRGVRTIDSALPVHIHVAEQVKEVEACKAATGRRPIELLLDLEVLDRHWCLVHATHATVAELKGIAAAGAAVCICITTEANLGDGFFDSARFLNSGGRACIGSDSQASVCPAEELRWMEYQQRLRKRRRGVLAEKAETHVGTRLWRDAAQHGAFVLGQPAGMIEPGYRADWLVLDASHPSMAGATDATALDHLVFAGGSKAIRDVMVAGRWVVQDGHHEAEALLSGRFRALMAELA